MSGADTTPDPLREMRLVLTSLLLDGDAAGAFHFANDLMSSGVPFDDILFELIAPTEADFGRRWEYGDYGISQEHAATGAVETVLAMLTGSFDQPDDGDLIVVACAEGDEHSLPARMVAAYLVYLGHRVAYLGTSVPADDLAEYLATEQPIALVLSCALVTHLPGAHASVAAAHRAGVPVVAGGRGYGRDGRWATAIGADAWASHPRDVDPILATWEPGTGTTPPDTEFAARAADLRAHREEVLAASVPGFGDAADSRRMRQELALLFDAVVAGLLVDDAAVVAEISGWQDTMLAAQGFGEHRSQSLATALHAALADDYPLAADLLAVADGPA